MNEPFDQSSRYRLERRHKSTSDCFANPEQHLVTTWCRNQSEADWQTVDFRQRQAQLRQACKRRDGIDTSILLDDAPERLLFAATSWRDVWRGRHRDYRAVV